MDLNKITKSKEIAQKRIQILESQKKDLQADKEKLLVNVSVLEKEVEGWRKMCDNERRSAEDFKREKELLQKSFQRING